jgi:hypothetical protein
VLAGVIVLFAVAVIELGRTRWYPQGDLAMTELYVRDVASPHVPLLGLVGRIGTVGAEKGAHPGPISFYSLWPFYQLFGASAWALLAATACVHIAATATALWIAVRRGGFALALGVGAVVVALMAFLGPSVMTQPWNPYMPLLWWIVFVLAVWSVSCGDVVCLPVAAFAASFCVQTHVSYAALVGGGVIFATVYLIAQWRRGDHDARMRILRMSGLAGAISVVLWLPPIWQQFTTDDGNMSIVWRYFRNPPETPIGVHRGLDFMLLHLNPWTVIDSRSIFVTTGSLLPGVLMFALWVASVVVAWRIRETSLLRLHALVAIALATGIWSMGRIFGFVWYYDMLWAWCLCGIVIISVVATATTVARSHHSGAISRLRNVVLSLTVVLLIATSVLFVREAVDVEVPPSAAANAFVAKLVTPTITALRKRGAVPGGGRGGIYLVRSSDPVLHGSHAFAFVNELDRAGLDVGMDPSFERYLNPAHTFDQVKATAIVDIAVGEADIAHWEDQAGAVEVVKVDPATPADRRRFNELRADVLSHLREAGLNRLVALLDSNLFLATADNELPAALRPSVVKMDEIGLPEAVFVAPVIQPTAGP